MNELLTTCVKQRNPLSEIMGFDAWPTGSDAHVDPVRMVAAAAAQIDTFHPFLDAACDFHSASKGKTPSDA